MKSTLFFENLGVIDDLVISMELLSSILFSTAHICSCPYEEVYYPYRCVHKSSITLLLADFTYNYMKFNFEKKFRPSLKRKGE